MAGLPGRMFRRGVHSPALLWPKRHFQHQKKHGPSGVWTEYRCVCMHRAVSCVHILGEIWQRWKDTLSLDKNPMCGAPLKPQSSLWATSSPVSAAAAGWSLNDLHSPSGLQKGRSCLMGFKLQPWELEHFVPVSTSGRGRQETLGGRWNLQRNTSNPLKCLERRWGT